MAYNLPDLLLRLCFAGPVLFIGVSMMLDPQSFTRWSEDLAQALHTVTDRYQRPMRVFDTRARSRTAASTIRLAGVTVILFAFVWFLS